MIHRSEAGTTLIETLLTIVIVSLVILALATGLLTTLFSANQVNTSERLSVAAMAMTESLHDLPYLGSCPANGTGAAYLQLYNNLPADQRTATKNLELKITNVEFWKSNRGVVSPRVPATEQWSASCAEAGGAQKLTVSVSTPGPAGRNKVTVTAQVVKRQESRQ